MSDPVNMTHINHLRMATRDAQAAAANLKRENDRLAGMLDALTQALEKRGPGRPPKVEAA